MLNFDETIATNAGLKQHEQDIARDEQRIQELQKELQQLGVSGE